MQDTTRRRTRLRQSHTHRSTAAADGLVALLDAPGTFLGVPGALVDPRADLEEEPALLEEEPVLLEEEPAFLEEEPALLEEEPVPLEEDRAEEREAPDEAGRLRDPVSGPGRKGRPRWAPTKEKTRDSMLDLQ